MQKKEPSSLHLLLSKTSSITSQKIVIVQTEWNAELVASLAQKCTEILNANFLYNIDYVTVPGAVEIPYAIKQIWETKKNTLDAPSVFIALGTVIRGGTPHFEYVCNMLTNSIAQLNIQIDVPTIMGVLTVDTMQQALERMQNQNHKGQEFALAAIHMLLFKQSLKS